MERNEIVGNAVARTDRSALIKATRASDFPRQNIACKLCRGSRGFRYSHQTLFASFVEDPEDSDFPREFVTKNSAKLRQKNEKSKLNHTKRYKRRIISRIKNTKMRKKKPTPAPSLKGGEVRGRRGERRGEREGNAAEYRRELNTAALIINRTTIETAHGNSEHGRTNRLILPQICGRKGK